MSLVLTPAGRNTVRSVPARVVIIGDSISVTSGAFGASSIANMWVSRVKSRYTTPTYVETSVVGSTLNAQLNINNSQLALSSSDLIIGVLLFNTMRTLGPDPSFLGEYNLQIEGALSWLAVPESQKIRAVLRGTTTPNPQVVTTGTWAYFAVTSGTDLNQLAIRSNSANATATFPAVSGDTVYVWYFRSTLSEQFRVSIDGITFNVGGPVSYTSWLGGLNSWELCCLRVSGLTNAAHTVVVTQTPGIATIAGVAGLVSNPYAGPVTTPDCPLVIIGNCLKMISGTSAQGYAFAGSTANDPLSQNGNIVLSSGTVTNAPFLYGHAGVAAYNAVLARSVQSLQADGLRIALLDVDQAFVPGSMVSGDFVHPNDGGHAMLFQNFRRALDPAFQLP